MYLAPLLNLPPRGAYSDAKQVVQYINLLNARGANMVIYGMWNVIMVLHAELPKYTNSLVVFLSKLLVYISIYCVYFTSAFFVR